MSRRPTITAFVGPGHKRHAFYRGSHATLHPACGIDCTGKIINHEEPHGHGRTPVSCAKCLRIMELVLNGRTPPHLVGVIS